MNSYQGIVNLIQNFLKAVAPVICKKVYDENISVIDRVIAFDLLSSEGITWKINDFATYMPVYKDVFTKAELHYQKNRKYIWEVKVLLNPEVLTYEYYGLLQFLDRLLCETITNIDLGADTSIITVIAGLDARKIGKGKKINALSWVECARYGYLYNLTDDNFDATFNRKIILTVDFRERNYQKQFSFFNFAAKDDIFFSVNMQHMLKIKDLKVFNELGVKYGCTLGIDKVSPELIRQFKDYIQKGLVTSNIIFCFYNITGNKHKSEFNDLLDKYGIQYYYDEMDYIYGINVYLRDTYKGNYEIVRIHRWTSNVPFEMGIYV